MTLACLNNPVTDAILDIHLSSPAQTERFAQHIAPYITAPMLITLSGDIGSGKTTLVRAMLRAMGVSARIKSPTYSLIESYDLPTQQIHHFDLYRIHDETELEMIGFRDYFQPTAVCCVEWPERVHFAPEEIDLALMFTRSGQGRDVKMKVQNNAQSLLKGLKTWNQT